MAAQGLSLLLPLVSQQELLVQKHSDRLQTLGVQSIAMASVGDPVHELTLQESRGPGEEVHLAEC